MPKLGHHRPVGTTTRIRMRWGEDAPRDPALGDITQETGTERWYQVVGIEEHRDSPAVWWLTLLRIAPRYDGTADWGHTRDRRTVR